MTTEINAIAAPTNEGEVKDYIASLLRAARHDEAHWPALTTALTTLLTGDLSSISRELLTEAARKERLDFQWTLDEVLESTAPEAPEPVAPPAPEPEPEPEPAEEPQAPTPGPVTPEDLQVIYDDPRGIMIHEHLTDQRWFLTQINPNTGQPQTAELSEMHKVQVRSELMGSPYWVNKPSEGEA